MNCFSRCITKLSEACFKFRHISTSSALKSITLKYNPNAQLSKTLLDRYLDLPVPDCITQIKYIWIDGTGEDLRSKTRTLDFIPKCAAEVPIWTYAGCATYQASVAKSEIFLCPRVLYNDPIRRGHNKLVLCDTYDMEHKPTKTNFRFCCQDAMECVVDEEPWFGIEQEFVLIDADGRPFWPTFGYPEPEGPYYCGVGAHKVFARELMEAHYRACLYAGIQYAGTNMETMPCQWEYQIGPSLGIKAADDLWISRFLLLRLAEEWGIGISFKPKLIEGWSGSGAHHNFSTKKMREKGGMKYIEEAIAKLCNKHKEHLARYDPSGGCENRKRLSGNFLTGHFDKFTYGVGSRLVSVRIPVLVADACRGFLEDRRPAANCDPYRVCEAIVRTCILNQDLK